jgi:hypothetical protein
MKKDFVPFFAATANGSSRLTESRTEVVAGSSTAIAFRPLSQATAPSPTAPTAHGEPTMTLEREGNRVARIKIQCPCGHVVELVCDYTEGTQA